MTTPTVAAPSITEDSTGMVTGGGSAFYSFTVGENGTVNVTCSAAGGGGVPGSVWLGLGLGAPNGEGCITTSNVNTPPTSTAQLTGTYAPGIYCVKAQTFTGTLVVGAARFYSFTVTSGGTTTASLASVTSAQDNTVLDAILELGIGFPSGTGCEVTTTKNVSPALTTQILTSGEPGIRCVRVADVGDLNTPIKFAVRFAHP